MNIRKPLAVAAMSVAVLMPAASGTHAATDEYAGCFAYNKPVTLTGTVLIRKINYEKMEDAPPEGSVPFPLLVADHARGPRDRVRCHVGLELLRSEIEPHQARTRGVLGH